MHAGTGVTAAEHAKRPHKVAVPFKAPDGNRRPKRPIEQQEQSSKLSALDGTTAAVAADKATAGAELVDPSQRVLPPKPRPRTEQKGGMLHGFY